MKARIVMETLQTVDGEGELLVHESNGILRRNSEGWRATYLLDGIHHEMQLDPLVPSVTVIRNWQDRDALRYERGLRHTVLYETPAGCMEICFSTRRVEIREQGGGAGIAALLDYRISQHGGTLADCLVRIDISPII